MAAATMPKAKPASAVTKAATNTPARNTATCNVATSLMRPRSSRRAVRPGRSADRLPRRVAAGHELRVEAEIPQLDGGLASDVESVGAEHDDRVRFRQLADPFLDALPVAPRR